MTGSRDKVRELGQPKDFFYYLSAHLALFLECLAVVSLKNGMEEEQHSQTASFKTERDKF